MRPALDPTQPGPAGLFFDRSILTPAGIEQDREACRSLEHPCFACGLLHASFGYGVGLYGSCVWTCVDPECRARGEAWAAERRLAAPEGGRDAQRRPEPAVERAEAGDLFGCGERAA